MATEDKNMAFSRSELNSLLLEKGYSDASQYIKDKLTDARNDAEALISLVEKCTGIVAYHVYHIESTDEKIILREITELILIFVNSLEIVSLISIPTNLNALKIDKILLSTYQVRST